MLKIHFGSLKSEIKSPKLMFNIEYDSAWFDDPFVLEMVQDVEGVELVTHREFRHPAFGNIGVFELSGGLKNLILAYKLNRIIDASFCGDNCAKWLLRIAEKKDLHITLGHVMDFSQKDPDMSFRCYITNNHKWVNSLEEYAQIACHYVLRLK